VKSLKQKAGSKDNELMQIDLDARKKDILRAIINEYIDTIEPVSSNTLIEKYDLNCSSATVRNEMAELEKEGFLEKTHTSSGRVPSNKGYQFYVDNLLNEKNLNLKEISYINSRLESTVSEMENLTKIATNTISEVTHYTTVAIEPDSSNQIIQEFKFVLLGSRMIMAIIMTESGTVKETIIKFDDDITQSQVNTISTIFNNKLKGKPLAKIDIPIDQYIKKEMSLKIDVIKTIVDQINRAIMQESRLYLNGTKHALDNPEFQKNDLAKEFYGLLDNQDVISEILNNEQDFNVYIGNAKNGLEDLSIVTFKNRVNGKDLGTIGIIGPTRMDYSKIISVLKYINQELNKGADIKRLQVPESVVGTNLQITDGSEIKKIKSKDREKRDKSGRKQ
jgi:heat-inducible transcriptional repressor